MNKPKSVIIIELSLGDDSEIEITSDMPTWLTKQAIVEIVQRTSDDNLSVKRDQKVATVSW